MEGQESNSKIHVVFFSISIILFCLGAVLGMSLSVSRDVLASFALCGDAMHRSNENTKAIVAQEYAALDNTADGQTTDTNAQRLQQLSYEMVRWIEQLRFDMILYVDGETEAIQYARNEVATSNNVPYVPATEIVEKDALNPSWFFLEDIDKTVSQNCRATELKLKLNTYKEAILELVPAEKQEKVRQELTFLNTDGHYENYYEETITWEEYLFEHVMACAVATELDAIIGDIKTAEYIILRNL